MLTFRNWQLGVALAGAVLGCSRPALAEAAHVVSVMAGVGLVAPESSVNGIGSGAIGGAEYAYQALHWVAPRSYAGVLFAGPGGGCDRGVDPCELSAEILFAGAKGRLMAPIPYVGPFFEVGLGASAGKLSTRIGADVDTTMSGVDYHVPVGLGIGFGPTHEVQVSFQYLFHPRADVVAGGVVLAYAVVLPTSRLDRARPRAP
jgi:hypothetical protein